MPKLCTGAVEALRRHLAPELTEENRKLRARVTLLEMLLRDMEAAELLHEHCVWCFGESAPEACERCVLLVADLRMRRSMALSGRPEQQQQNTLQCNWRTGSKVPLNVYDGDRPVCQCHSVEDATRIVTAMNTHESSSRQEKQPR